MQGTEIDFKTNIKKFFSYQEVVVAIVLVAIGIFLAIERPTTFLTSRNIFNILRQSSLYAVLAVGMGMVIISGGIDLSIGAIIAYSACLGAFINSKAVDGVSPILILLIILCAGALAGLINGLLVAKLGIPPFIATMGTLSVGSGIALLITNGSPIAYKSTWISVFGGGYVGKVPVSVIVMFAVVILGYLFLKYTVTGRNIYSVGNNPRASKLSGINTEFITILVYVISGFLSSLCGLMMMGQLNSAGPNYGKGYELDTIAAAVIGGISMSGGEGNILGVALGAILMALLKNMFTMMSVSGYWQTIILGIVIILSVAIDCVRKKRQEY